MLITRTLCCIHLYHRILFKKKQILTTLFFDISSCQIRLVFIKDRLLYFKSKFYYILLTDP